MHTSFIFHIKAWLTFLVLPLQNKITITRISDLSICFNFRFCFCTHFL